MQKALLVLAVAAALTAQAPRLVEQKIVEGKILEEKIVGPSVGAFTFMSAEANFETSIVKGAPFTGDFITENTQTLGDGNRINNSNATSYARDGEGRTRREITIGTIGPFSGGAPRKAIFINDPVSNVDYVLDPHEKTARKTISMGLLRSKVKSAAAPGNEGPNVVFTSPVESSKDVVIEHRGPDTAVAERVALPPGLIMHDGHAGAVIGQRMEYAPGIAASTAQFKNEPLGKRIIEGVEAEGTRTILTIPAGQIGNEMPLDTISERWYSDELKTVIMTTRKDPRTGESTYKLTNLRRGEPSRLLFELPSDYKIITEDIVGPNVIRMRVDKKQE